VTAAKLVSITLLPNPAGSIAKGTTLQLTATGFFDDGKTQDLTDTATWASSMTTVATISNDPISNGLATGRAEGTTNITARVVIGTTTVTSAPVTLTVTAATLVSVAITPATPSVAKGATLNLVATGTFTDGSTQVMTNTVTWASAAQTTATVSNAAGQRGRVTGVAVGMVVITATSGSKAGQVTLNVTAPVVASIAVTPATAGLTLARNATRQFTAEATLTDGTKQTISATATWTSSTPATATISASGLATGVAAGTTQISATSGGVTSNKVMLTVTN